MICCALSLDLSEFHNINIYIYIYIHIKKSPTLSKKNIKIAEYIAPAVKFSNYIRII